LKLPKVAERILVVDLAMIGDLLCATPSLSAIRAAYPDSKISVLASQTSAPALAGNPNVNEVIGIDKKSAFRLPFRIFQTAAALRKRKFEIAFLLHNSIGSAIVAWMAGIKHRVGYATEGRGNLLTIRVALPKERQHLIEQRLSLLRKSGLDAPLQMPAYFVDSSRVSESLSRLLPSLDPGRPMVVLAVGSTWPTKIWPRKNVQAFLNKLPVGSVCIILVGAPGEESLAEGLNSISVPVYNLVGKTTIEELGHVISRADAVIAPDSGPMHIAEGLGKPTIGLFGPTDPKICGMVHSAGVHIQPHMSCLCCWEKKCKNRTFCMAEISPDSVIDALFRAIGNTAPAEKEVC
jgi:heptosyltransferase-1